MHIEELGFILEAFIATKRVGHRTRIEGCGIGPLDMGSKYQKTVQRILELADIITLRDSHSVRWASNRLPSKTIIQGEDPAEGFVREWKRKNNTLKEKRYLSLYLRQWPYEYKGGMSDDTFQRISFNFENMLSKLIHVLCTRFDLRPRLLAMHHFCIGGDDRDFNRNLVRNHLKDLDVLLERRPFNLHEILNSMQESKLCLCMRYHSVLFAYHLSKRFIAIDYSRGGKINAFLSDHGSTDRLLSLENVAKGEWMQIISLVESWFELSKSIRWEPNSTLLGTEPSNG